MSILVVGSVALDTIRTPFGYAEETLGGSATYFSVAARFFSDVQLVAVVGEDFPDEHIAFLASRGVDLKGLMRRRGKTFRWTGEYLLDLNEAKTIRTELNVFEHFRPVIPEEYKDAEVVFLANIDPELQLDVVRQVYRPRLVACDTMNYWICHKPEQLRTTLHHVHIFFLNEAEARQLSGHYNLVKAARTIQGLGPPIVIKKGENGALLFHHDDIFWAPAYPLETIFDPTGAGDTFAGGFIGYVSQEKDLSPATLRRGLVYGSILASFNVEDFSLRRMTTVSMDDIHQRLRELHLLTWFEAR